MKDGAKDEIERMNFLAIWLDDYICPWLFKKVCWLFYRPSPWRFTLPSNERLTEIKRVAKKHHISVRRADKIIMEELDEIVDRAGDDFKKRYRPLTEEVKKV